MRSAWFRRMAASRSASGSGSCSNAFCGLREPDHATVVTARRPLRVIRDQNQPALPAGWCPLLSRSDL